MNELLDDLPRPDPRKHEIGQDLSLLSVQDLGERIEALKAEIARLEAMREKKQASKSAADTFFKL
jgi:uncharacterized small protein (DUF1192 family)